MNGYQNDSQEISVEFKCFWKLIHQLIHTIYELHKDRRALAILVILVKVSYSL